MARQTGHKERRYAHLLCGEPGDELHSENNNTDSNSKITELEKRLTQLENELYLLKEKLTKKNQ